MKHGKDSDIPVLGSWFCSSEVVTVIASHLAAENEKTPRGNDSSLLQGTAPSADCPPTVQFRV
jgi:hypothetical protein